MNLETNALIIGAVLGDAHIQKTQSNTGKCRLRIAHGPDQEEYLNFKYQQLAGMIPSSPKYDHHNKTFHFYTYYSLEMKKYHDLFYKPVLTKTGWKYQKTIKLELKESLTDAFSLAIWYCDDGSKRSNADACRIATHGYSLEEIKILQWILKENFNIPSHIVKAGRSPKKKHQWYVLSFAARDGGFLKLREWINPYVCTQFPQMIYKLKLLRPRND